MAERVLILTASVGEGHNLPARTLTDQIKAESPETEVVVADGLRAMGRQFILVNETAPGVVFYRFRWIWDAAFWFFVTSVPSRRFMQWYVWRTGSRGLMRLIAADEPRCDRLGLPGHDGGARPPAAQRSAQGAGLRGDHRPRDDALLGGEGDRRAPDHASRDRARGSLGRRPGD